MSILEMHMECAEKCGDFVTFWYKLPNLSLEKGLYNLTNDKDVISMTEALDRLIGYIEVFATVEDPMESVGIEDENEDNAHGSDDSDVEECSWHGDASNYDESDTDVEFENYFDHNNDLNNNDDEPDGIFDNAGFGGESKGDAHETNETKVDGLEGDDVRPDYSSSYGTSEDEKMAPDSEDDGDSITYPELNDNLVMEYLVKMSS